MAIDSAEKRKSAYGTFDVRAIPSVTPNSGKDAEWRQQVQWGYSGIPVTVIVTAAVTGDTTILESEVVTGSKQIIVTLTNDTWAATLGADNAVTDAFIAGFDSDGAEAGGWNATVRDAALAFGDITRDSDTQVTVVLPAVGAYSIDSDETVTITLDASTLVTSGSDVTATPTFSITAEADGPTTPAPDGKIGAAKAGMNLYDKSARRRQQALQDEDDFLQIIKIALPEIMKYLK